MQALPWLVSTSSGGLVQRLGRYSVGPEIASGGMASVRLGQLKGAGGFCKLVAIKRLHAELAADPGSANLLVEEARLNAAINHPNVVSLLDVFEHAGELQLVMDYVHGETLAQLLRASRKRASTVPVAIVRRVLCDALQGLHAAHTATAWDGTPLSIVHRDVSPENIMVGVDGIAKMLDFGVAKAARGNNLTSPGHVKGKLAYMAPEQVRKQPLDARTDVFAAGVVLWEALAGRRLFAAQTVEQGISKLLSGPIPRVSTLRQEVDEALDQVVERAVARSTEARFGSALEFADALAATGPLAARAEVTAWVRGLAGAALDRRAELRDELDGATVEMLAAKPASSARHALKVRTRGLRLQLSRKARRWGAGFAAAGGVLAVALACAMLLRQEPSASREAVAAVAPTPIMLAPVTIPCGTATEPQLGPMSVSVLPPVQPESLQVEERHRAPRSPTRPRAPQAARSGRAAYDLLGF